MNCLDLLDARKALEKVLLVAPEEEKQELRVAAQAIARECRELGCRLEIR